jgi:hypothetical protein
MEPCLTVQEELVAAMERLRLLEDFRRAYDAWAHSDEQTAAKLFDEMLASRETLK